MTTFIGNDEKLHWRVCTAKWYQRLIALTIKVVDPLDPHDFNAHITPEFVHFTVPPMGARGAVTVTLPRQLPDDPDWELMEQLQSLETCFYGGTEFAHPALTPISE